MLEQCVRAVDEVFKALTDLCGTDDPAGTLIEHFRHLMEHERDPPADLDKSFDDGVARHLTNSQQEAACELSGLFVGQGAER